MKIILNEEEIAIIKLSLSEKCYECQNIKGFACKGNCTIRKLIEKFTELDSSKMEL